MSNHALIKLISDNSRMHWDECIRLAEALHRAGYRLAEVPNVER
jgi:hypothetical protein